MLASEPERGQNSLRILMTADAVGGVWQYCVDLVTSVAERGAEVMLVTMGPRPRPEQTAQLLAIPRVSLQQSDFALEWMPNPWSDVDAAGEWLLELQSSFDPHVIHVNGYAHASLPWRKPVIVTAHSCVYSWWRAVHGSAPGNEWAEYKRRISGGLSAADLVIAPSVAMATSLQSEYGVSGDKIRVIHNFTRAGVPAYKTKRAFFLAAGRIWDLAKNLDLLEKIAPRLNWPVCVAGDATGPDGSTDKLESVQFLGALPRTELINYMNAANIFVHPALYEPFGLSVLEAARARCCLVLSDIPSLRELWDGAAVFINPRDEDRWVYELNALSRDLSRCKVLARLARSHSAKYRTGPAIDKYWKAYRSLKRPQEAAA